MRKKLRSTYCTIDVTKLTTDRHEASRGLFATAELLVGLVLGLHVKIYSLRGVRGNQQLPLFILGPLHMSEINGARKLLFGKSVHMYRY